jgi:Zn-dependent peptidase ImmA (M78 family)
MNKFEIYSKTIAKDFREKNGYSSSEPISLQSLLVKLKVLTIFKRLDFKFSGMAIKSGDNRFALINSVQTLGRQNFTICHELYHLFIQEDFQSRVCETAKFNKKDTEEYLADLFAINLLLPEDGVLSNIPREQLTKDSIELDTIIEIEQIFGSSRTALLVRLKNLGLLSHKKFNEYKKNVIKSALERGFDTSLYKPLNSKNIVSEYGKIAKNLFDDEKISESHYYNLMDDIGFNIWDEELNNDEFQ